ncbi:hypothetical protein IMG5_048230 [Ichthyophthirius multifiliis]|uniref:PX domain-containing protein n=1 Tax=Ichthyophthirius multifiliis TaxID=5932 RepID=G0QMF5_ICHMU|nr:hypothetical protein IMG5_048230 [Ichthyophthirius multifiliis]EGR33606.1 hypothetical protein IMG5_048230 [Ichthyophthirius multifiliis]|eukprot:XP_004037592.1 hypothetical protein IMG5_048230 [Ichthyophthirius multifiliis]
MHERALALLEQENQRTQKENIGLLEKIHALENENRTLRTEKANLDVQIHLLQNQLEALDQKKSKMLNLMQNEHEQQLLDISSESDKNKIILKQHSQLVVEKNCLENKVETLKKQLEESQMKYEKLINTIQNQQIQLRKNKEGIQDESFSQNSFRNNNNLDVKVEYLEGKNNKLKQFKKMINASTSIQCIYCSKFISTKIFFNHINLCINKNNQENSPQDESKTNINIYNLSQLPVNFLNLDQNDFTISIYQTVVREANDNQPFTEYIIQMIYQLIKWTIARKYKNFCELHTLLMNTFPGLKIQEQGNLIISDLNGTSKTIEDRCKNLQQYIRELVKIDIVRNSKPFKNFLEIDKYVEKYKL